MDAREATVAEVQAATGAVFIPPYNDGAVISGQGTIALELLQQVKFLATGQIFGRQARFLGNGPDLWALSCSWQ